MSNQINWFNEQAQYDYCEVQTQLRVGLCKGYGYVKVMVM